MEQTWIPGTPMPLNTPACPLCGQPNACVTAATGRFDASCWCTQVGFPPELLARVPDAERMRSCICRACVEAAQPRAVGDAAGTA